MGPGIRIQKPDLYPHWLGCSGLVDRHGLVLRFPGLSEQRPVLRVILEMRWKQGLKMGARRRWRHQEMSGSDNGGTLGEDGEGANLYYVYLNETLHPITDRAGLLLMFSHG